MLNNYKRRKLRVRSKIDNNNKGNRHKIVVKRSNKNFHSQLIDLDGNVVTSFSTLSLKSEKNLSGIENAKESGKRFAKLCTDKKITKVVFEKSVYSYSGRVKAFAESCRENGLEF
jgi:large subunit ribosomal protein L18